MLNKLVLLAGFTAAGMLTISAANAQEYPSKPIRIITSTAGGGTDIVSRIVAQGLTVALKQQVVVDNRASAVTGETVAMAPPDGYTLLLNGTGFWIAPLVQVKPAYDSVRDFAPISLLTTTQDALVVHPSVPVKSVKELIAFAKAHPGELNYASSAIGTPTHLGSELLKSLAKINIVRVPYRGVGAAYSAIVAGEVHMMLPNLGGAIPYIDSGRLRILAVTGAKRSVFRPNVPTVAETLPGYRTESTYGLFAPANTPPAIVALLNKEAVRFLTTAQTKERLYNTGFEVVASTAQELGDTVKSDLQVWGKVMRDAGIRPEQ